MKYFPLLIALFSINAWSCPQFNGSDFTCDGGEPDFFEGIVISGNRATSSGEPAQSFILDGSPHPRDNQGVIVQTTATCSGNTITTTERTNGLTATSTLTFSGSQITVVGTTIETTCMFDDKGDCDPARSGVAIVVQNISCRRK